MSRAFFASKASIQRWEWEREYIGIGINTNSITPLDMEHSTRWSAREKSGRRSTHLEMESDSTMIPDGINSPFGGLNFYQR